MTKQEMLERAEKCAKYDFDTVEMVECKWELWDNILEVLRTPTQPPAARETYTEICKNQNCPRGGKPVEIVGSAVPPEDQAREALKAILIRCTEGDKSFDWLETIADIAERALSSEGCML